MTTFLITYDLLTPGKDYNRLFKAIRELSGAYWHGMQNIWFVKGDQLSATGIRDTLKNNIDSTDVLFVCELDDWASWNLKGWDWLNG